MPRACPHTHLSNGRAVGFSVKLFGNGPTYIACFRSIDGRRLKRDTNQSRLPQAVEAARAFIDQEYSPQAVSHHTISWDDAAARFESHALTAGLERRSVDHYLYWMTRVRLAFKATSGPADISPGMAKAWLEKFAGHDGQSGIKPSGHTVRSVLIGLSSLWGKWLCDSLALVSCNPWADIPRVKTDKPEVKYASDEQMSHFAEWLSSRFAGWPLPVLFVQAKAHCGCRLFDLCSLPSDALQSGRLVFPAAHTKGRKARAVPLPPSLFANLDGIKGGTWLWEGYAKGLKDYHHARGYSRCRARTDFEPIRLYRWVKSVFAEYSAENPGLPALNSHMLRKRAFTKAWQRGIDPNKAAVTYGCGVKTMMGHYVALDEQSVIDEVIQEMHGVDNANS